MDCLVGVDPEAAEKAEAQSVLNGGSRSFLVQTAPILIARTNLDYNSECEIAGINVPTLSVCLPLPLFDYSLSKPIPSYVIS